MNTIRLYGSLATAYGDERVYAVRSAAEAVKALCVNLQGFREMLEGMNARVFWTTGPDPDDEARLDLDEELLPTSVNNSVLHIMPALEGSGNNGIGKVLLGVAIVAASVVTAGAAAGAGAALFGSGGALAGTAFLGVSYGTLALFGAGIALGGLAQMLAPKPVAPSAGDREDQRSSFQINNLGNFAQQGHCIPLAYGRCMCGSLTVLGAIQIEQVAVGPGTAYVSDGSSTDVAGGPALSGFGTTGVGGAALVNGLIFDPVDIYTGIDADFVVRQPG